MNSAIAWSCGLLSAAEQSLFRRLAVFAGSFTLEAAEALGADLEPASEDHRPSSSPAARVAIVDGIMSLHDKSLLRYSADHGGSDRFSMLEMIREYAEEWLIAAGEAEATRRDHAAYCLSLAERHQQTPFLPEQPVSLALLDAEQANLRAALLWLQDTGQTEAAARLVSALGWFWFVRGNVREAREWLEWALAPAHPAPALTRFPSMVALGMTLLNQGELARAGELLRGALAMARGAGDAVSSATVSLTPREAEILPLLVAGRTDREIATALFLSQRTVDNRVARILAKFAVHTRRDAAAAARAAGFLPVAGEQSSSPPPN